MIRLIFIFAITILFTTLLNTLFSDVIISVLDGIGIAFMFFENSAVILDFIWFGFPVTFRNFIIFALAVTIIISILNFRKKG